MSWTEVGDGIWVRSYEPWQVNVTAIDAGGGLVVIDTRGSHVEGRELRDDLKALGVGPVLAVINTHHHFDHTFGNDAFRDVPRWGHDRCADHLLARVEGDTTDIEDAHPDLPDELRTTLMHSPPVAPDRTFVDRATVDVGDRPLTLRHLGRGHTDNDVVVVVGDGDVIVAGDLVEQAGPPAFEDAHPLAWPDTLDRLGALVTGAVVPGHGAVVDADFVAAQADDLRRVAELCRRSFEDATPLDDLLADAPYPTATVEVARIRALHELVREPWPWARFEDEGWSVDLPDVLIRQPAVITAPDSDLRTMALARGWLHDDAIAVVISTAPRGEGAATRCARTADVLDTVHDRRTPDVPGALSAARLEGEWVLDEALSPSGHEHLAQVIAETADELVIVTVRVARAAVGELAPTIDRILSSVAVRPG